MKQIINKIEICNQCPYCRTNGNFQYWEDVKARCDKMIPSKIIDKAYKDIERHWNTLLIPDFCPLDDYVNNGDI